MSKEDKQKEKEFTIIDQKDFNQTQEKATDLKSLVYRAEWFAEEEKEELLKHIDEIAKQNLGV